MAGHALLPGCQRPWNHDECPGFQPSPGAAEPDAEPRMGGLACHCPCHGLQRRLDTAHAEAIRLRQERHGLTVRIVELETELRAARHHTVTIERIDDGPHVNFEG